MEENRQARVKKYLRHISLAEDFNQIKWTGFIGKGGGYEKLSYEKITGLIDKITQQISGLNLSLAKVETSTRNGYKYTHEGVEYSLIEIFQGVPLQEIMQITDLLETKDLDLSEQEIQEKKKKEQEIVSIIEKSPDDNISSGYFARIDVPKALLSMSETYFDKDNFNYLHQMKMLQQFYTSYLSEYRDLTHNFRTIITNVQSQVTQIAEGILGDDLLPREERFSSDKIFEDVNVLFVEWMKNSFFSISDSTPFENLVQSLKVNNITFDEKLIENAQEKYNEEENELGAQVNRGDLLLEILESLNTKR